jgi:hypothetical protein
MLTIKTTGDDAWNTDRRLLDALRCYHVRIGGEEAMIRGTLDDGGLVIYPVRDGQPMRASARLIETDGITIEVL